MTNYKTVEDRVRRNVPGLFSNEPEEFTIDHLAGYVFSIDDVKQAKRELREWDAKREKRI